MIASQSKIVSDTMVARDIKVIDKNDAVVDVIRGVMMRFS